MCKGVGLLYFSFCVETNIIFKSAQKTPSWFPRLTHPDICPSPQMFSLSLSLSLNSPYTVLHCSRNQIWPRGSPLTFGLMMLSVGTSSRIKPWGSQLDSGNMMPLYRHQVQNSALGVSIEFWELMLSVGTRSRIQP